MTETASAHHVLVAKESAGHVVVLCPHQADLVRLPYEDAPDATAPLQDGRPRAAFDVGRNIVNQLADLWKVPVDVRQATNDDCWDFAERLIEEYTAAQPSEGAATCKCPPELCRCSHAGRGPVAAKDLPVQPGYDAVYAVLIAAGGTNLPQPTIAIVWRAVHAFRAALGIRDSDPLTLEGVDENRQKWADLFGMAPDMTPEQFGVEPGSMSKAVEQLRFLADARKAYCHRCPANQEEAQGLSWQDLAVHEEHATAAWLAEILEGGNDGKGWLPSPLWSDWEALRRGTSNATAPAVGSSPARSNERGAAETIEAVRRLFNHLANGDYDGQVSMGFAATFDQHLDGILEEAASCPTCNGRQWVNGQWVATRETVGMVCQTCGHDYGAEPAGVSGDAVAAGAGALATDAGMVNECGFDDAWRERTARFVLNAAAPLMGATPRPVLDREAVRALFRGPNACGHWLENIMDDDEQEAAADAVMNLVRPGATPVASQERVAEVLGQQLVLRKSPAEIAGALLAAGVFREPPTAEEIAVMLNNEGAYCGECDFESGLSCSACKRVCTGYAKAVLSLLGGAE